MPRGHDSRQPLADWNPLASKLNWNTADITSEMAKALEKAVETFFNWTVDAVDQATGLDLSVWLPMIDADMQSLITLFGELNPLGSSFNPIGAIGTFFNLIETNALGIITNATSSGGVLGLPGIVAGLPGMLGGFNLLSGAPTMLEQLITAGGGTGSALGDFGAMLNALAGGLPEIFLTGLSTGVSLVSQLPSLLTLPLTGVTGLPGLFGGLDTSGSSSLLNQLPSLLTLPISAITGLIGAGGTILNSLIPGLPLGQITGLTGLLSGFDTSGSTSILGQLPSLLTLPISAITGLLDVGGTILGTLIPGLPLGQITGLTGLLGGFDTSGSTSILSQLPSLLTLPISAITGLIGVGGTILNSLIPGLPIGQITGLTGLLGGLDTTGSSSLLNQLPSLLTLPISAITSLAGYLTHLDPTGLLSLVGLGSGTLPGGIVVPGANLVGSVASSLLSGTIGAGLLPTITAGMTSGLAAIDTLVNAFGISGSGFLNTDLHTAAQAIPHTNIVGLLGGLDIGSALQMLTDNLFQGFTNTQSTGTSLANVNNAANNTQATAQGANDLAQSHASFISGMSGASPSWEGLGHSTDASFPIMTLTGSSAPVINVTQSQTAMAAIATPDGGVKESVWWWAPALPTNITSIVLNVYSIDIATGAETYITSTPNVVANAVVGWNNAALPAANYLNSQQGNWYRVEMQVQGTGTYQICGIPNHWLGPHPTAFPKQIGGQRGSTVLADTSKLLFSGTTISNSSWTYQGAAGAGVIVAVSIQLGSGSLASAWTRTATYNGQAMTSLGVVNGNNTTNGWVQLFALPSCATGNVDTIAVSTTGGTGTVQSYLIQALSFRGVGSFGTVVTNFGQASSLTTSGTLAGPSGGALLAAFQQSNTLSSVTITPESGWTAPRNDGANGSHLVTMMEYLLTPNGSAAAAITATTNGSNNYGVVAVPISPASVAGPSSIAAPGAPGSQNMPWFGLDGVVAPISYTPQRHSFATNGSGSYVVESWAKFVDVIPYGAGAGGNCGDGSTGGAGSGGLQASGATRTLVVGTDIPVGATLNYTVGKGGLGGNGTGSPANGRSNATNNGIVGTNGTASSVTWTDLSSVQHTLTAAGALANTTQFGGGQTGQGTSPQVETVNGQNYQGGAPQPAQGANGNGPGGSGAGGNGGAFGTYNSGGNGADGEVFFLARQS